jgi:hypothetical protein
LSDSALRPPPDDFAAIVESDIPSYYFNGFQNGAGVADVTSVLQLNGKPICVLNMSFTTAKTLSVMLGQIITSIEADTGQEIMTTQRIEAAARKAGRLTDGAQ